jgi:peptide deformylase
MSMAIRPILRFGHPVLHAPSSSVPNIDATIVALVNDMVETMYAAPGIGLAAPRSASPYA